MSRVCYESILKQRIHYGSGLLVIQVDALRQSWYVRCLIGV